MRLQRLMIKLFSTCPMFFLVPTMVWLKFYPALSYGGQVWFASFQVSTRKGEGMTVAATSTASSIDPVIFDINASICQTTPHG